MSLAQSLPEKSTTGRPLALRLAQLEIALGDRLSPELAGRTAARLFLSPRRFDRPEAERELLSRARRFDVNGLAAWRWGGGPPVLLVHGWEGRGAQLGAFVDPLVGRGFSVITFDAP